MSIAQLLLILIPLVRESFGPLVAKLLEKLLTKGAESNKVSLVAVEAQNSPPALKEFVKGLILRGLEAIPFLPPSLKSIAAQVIDRLDGLFLDLLWAKLFDSGLVSAPPVRSVPADAVPDPIDVPPEAEGAFFAEFGESV